VAAGPSFEEHQGKNRRSPGTFWSLLIIDASADEKFQLSQKITAQQAHRRDSSVEQGLAEPNPTGVLPRPAGRHPKQARPLVGQIRQARNSALAA